jgi:hypothetical protein
MQWAIAPVLFADKSPETNEDPPKIPEGRLLAKLVKYGIKDGDYIQIDGQGSNKVDLRLLRGTITAKATVVGVNPESGRISLETVDQLDKEAPRERI